MTARARTAGELGDDLGGAFHREPLSDRLADAGWITRRPAPANRRSTLLELTDAGRAILTELVALRINQFGAVAGRMSSQDRAALIQGTAAFTKARHMLADQTRTQRSRPANLSDRGSEAIDLAGGGRRSGLRLFGPTADDVWK